MVWWKRQSNGSESLDVAALLAEVAANPTGRNAAIRQLQQERKRLLRRQRAQAKQFKRVTPATVRTAARLGPQFGSMHLTQDLRTANARADDPSRSAQAADLEQQIATVDAAIAHLTGTRR